MSNRSQKQQLYDRLKRFLFEQVPYDEGIEHELNELNSIVGEIIDLKFDGARNRVWCKAYDKKAVMVYPCAVPLPTAKYQSVEGQDEYRTECQTALQSALAGATYAATMLDCFPVKSIAHSADEDIEA